MTIRKYTYILLAFILGGLVLTFSNQHSRWLVLNGIAASDLSKKLLTQQLTKTPDWAIDLVIVSNPKDQTVSFSEHHSDFSYVYSPNNAPISKNFHWQHLIGSWYVGKIKT